MLTTAKISADKDRSHTAPKSPITDFRPCRLLPNRDEPIFCLDCPKPWGRIESMGLQRRHPAVRFIALLTAAVMPLCCCIVGTAAGTSCCTSVEIVQAPSCCSTSCCQEATSTEPVDQSCDDSLCSCCLKAPVNATNWTPPIDTIGTPLPAFDIMQRLVAATAEVLRERCGGNDPPPRLRDPDRLRGHVILQV